MASSESSDGMVNVPAFLQIDMLNGTRLSGRFASYSDPDELSTYTPFRTVDREGVRTYLHGASILRVTVFPLGSEPTDEA